MKVSKRGTDTSIYFSKAAFSRFSAGEVLRIVQSAFVTAERHFNYPCTLDISIGPDTHGRKTLDVDPLSLSANDILFRPADHFNAQIQLRDGAGPPFVNPSMEMGMSSPRELQIVVYARKLTCGSSLDLRTISSAVCHDMQQAFG